MLNHVVMQGRFTAAPEVKTSTSGNQYVNFTIANDGRGAAGDKTTTFARCAAFGKTADFIGKWFNRGDMAIITGRLEIGSYTNKDGVKMTDAKILVSTVDFCGGKREQAADTEPQPQAFAADDGDSELPF